VGEIPDADGIGQYGDQKEEGACFHFNTAWQEIVPGFTLSLHRIKSLDAPGAGIRETVFLL
jgi:hypothetical protein